GKDSLFETVPMTEPRVETAAPTRLARWLGSRGSAQRVWASVLGGVVVGLLLALGVETYDVLLGRNFHVVRPGAVYRVAQPAAALLLHTNATLDEARRQMSWRYGHLSFSKTGRLDDFFDLYERWLRERTLDHTPEYFRRYACFEYCPGPLRCRLEVLVPPPPV